MQYRFWINLLILTLFNFSIADSSNYCLTVRAHNFRNNNGAVYIFLFDSTALKGYPYTDHAICKKKASIEELKTSVTFDSLPIGEYAVYLFHDEDNDGKLKTGLFGLPKEGVGFSNNVRPFLGPPKFKNAKIIISDKNQIIDIVITYL